MTIRSREARSRVRERHREAHPQAVWTVSESPNSPQPPPDGAMVSVCLVSARWMCDLLRTVPTPGALALPVARLVDAYRFAVHLAGEFAPALLPVRELLHLVARLATGAPTPPPDVFDHPSDVDRGAPVDALARLHEGYCIHLLQE